MDMPTLLDAGKLGQHPHHLVRPLEHVLGKFLRRRRGHRRETRRRSGRGPVGRPPSPALYDETAEKTRKTPYCIRNTS